jgi:hypothetical protein
LVPWGLRLISRVHRPGPPKCEDQNGDCRQYD